MNELSIIDGFRSRVTNIKKCFIFSGTFVSEMGEAEGIISKFC